MSSLPTTAAQAAAGGESRHVRLDQLDGLRAVAALCVVAFHCTTRFDQKYLHSQPLPLSLDYGYLGVNLFFVISGFVIFMTIERLSTQSDFVVARFSRLFPTYWIALICTWLLTLALPVPGNVRSVWEVLGNLSMVHESFGVPSVDGAYWSLEVELIFYVWMVALWSLGLLQRASWLILAWLGAAAAAEAARQWLHVELSYTLMHFGLLRWIPWFALGMLSYLAWSQSRLALSHGLGVVVAILAIALRGQWYETLTAVACFLAVSLAARGRLAPAAWSPLVWIGACSYPLYLVHEQLSWLLMLKVQKWGWAPLPAILAAVTASILAAWGLHRAVELPSMRWLRSAWKERLHPPMVSPPGIRWVWVSGSLLLLLSLAVGSRVAAGSASRPERVIEPIGQVAESAIEVDCANGNGGRRRVVLLVLGQSNAASSARGERSPAIEVFHNGLCLRTGDPLPGTSGAEQSVWTSMIPTLEHSRPDWRVVISPLAVGGSSIDDWTRRDRIGDLLDAQLDSLHRAGLVPDAVLLQDGETDTARGTEARDYAQGMIALRAKLDRHDVHAPIIAARSAYCRGAGAGIVRRVVERLASASPTNRIVLGPDIDRIGPESRYDGCHLDQHGREVAADAWAETVVREVDRFQRAE